MEVDVMMLTRWCRHDDMNIETTQFKVNLQPLYFINVYSYASTLANSHQHRQTTTTKRLRHIGARHLLFEWLIICVQIHPSQAG